MVIFENSVKSMPPNLLESKLTHSFCFPFKIPDDPTATNKCDVRTLGQYLVVEFQAQGCKITLINSYTHLLSSLTANFHSGKNITHILNG